MAQASAAGSQAVLPLGRPGLVRYLTFWQMGGCQFAATFAGHLFEIIKTADADKHYWQVRVLHLDSKAIITRRMFDTIESAKAACEAKAAQLGGRS